MELADRYQPSPFEELAAKEMKDALLDCLADLSEREQEIIRLYYFEDLTMAEIANHLGIVESRVSQIHAAIIAKLRKKLVRANA
jgi:RNA polymerase sigma factor FliA